MLLLWGAFSGAVLAIVLVLYAMFRFEDAYDRVAFYLTVLASDVTVSIFAYILLSHTVFIYLSTIALSQVVCWALMNHQNMVHYKAGD